MGGSGNVTTSDFWVCRDDEGLLHNAKVTRFFDAAGRLTSIQVASACRPRVQQTPIDPSSGYHAANLPPTTLSNPWGRDRITLVEYRIREAPTCVRCATLANAFAGDV
jgi:hypothetical protein